MLGQHIRSNDILKIVEGVPPECSIPCMIDDINGFILLLQPFTEFSLAILAVAFVAVLV